MNKGSPTQNTVEYALQPLSGWRRVVRFARRPLQHQYCSVASRFQAWFPHFSFPTRLPSGSLYFVSEGEVDHRILFGNFEPAETHFLQQYLTPGMKVLDLGAHHGYYSLLASRAVGNQGAVHSFEPSPREFAQLRRNIRWNHCTNVRIHNVALGASRGTATLYQASKRLDGFNSMRPPDSVRGAIAVEVPLLSLDDFLASEGLSDIDFVKMDIEGAELSVLQGASRLLDSPARPVFLAEVSDLRTQAWGYPAVEIVRHLENRGFQWFEPLEQVMLTRIDTTLSAFNHNLVAVPREKLDRVRYLLLQN